MPENTQRLQAFDLRCRNTNLGAEARQIQYLTKEPCIPKILSHPLNDLSWYLCGRIQGPRDGNCSTISERTYLNCQSTMSQTSSKKAGAGRGKPALGTKLQKRRRIIRLQVGETTFTTTHHTLCKESAYFQTLLSDRNQQLTNGTYFVDADPDLFAHILRYLRHGIYPISFTPNNIHDHATYLGIERLAADFGIERLVKWTVDKQYESAIECSVSFERVIAWHSQTASPISRPMMTDHVDFVPDSNGRIWEVKKRLTARPEAFLAEPQGSR